MAKFTQYRRKQIAELRPYEPDESMEGISISTPDKEAGSPKPGDMIARNPKNHADQWLVAAQYFNDNFEPLAALSGAQEAVAFVEREVLTRLREGKAANHADLSLRRGNVFTEPLFASPPVPVAHICGCPATGTYEGQVTLIAPDWLKHKWPNGIGIDACLALEISNLWKAGIQTTGHCCGHGRAEGFISVWPEFIGHMKALGYETYPHPDGRGDHFRPKTRLALTAALEQKEPEA